MSHRERLILAIDGGGTKTDAIIARCVEDAAPEVIARAQAGPSNPTTNRRAALQEIAQAISLVAGQSGVSLGEFSIALFALAGVAEDTTRQFVLDWAHGKEPDAEDAISRLADEIYVISDAELILAIAEGTARDDQRAVGLIAGTGSIAFGRARPNAEILRVGGWGHLLGDDGGGFWIGRQALRHVLAELDAGTPPSPLQERILEFADSNSSRSLVTSIYRDVNPARKIASFAELVETAADDGDAAANELLADAAQRLSRCVETLSQKLGGKGPAISLACGGSLLTRPTRFAKMFSERIKTSGIEDLYFVEDPALAAVQVAAALA